MAKRGKKYRQAAQLVDRNKLYTVAEACELAKKSSYSKMNASVDIAVNLGVDPRQADQNLRGATPLPHGSGKTVRIIVFARGDKALEAKNLGIEAVGADDLAEKVSGGWLDFEHVVATPDMMGTVGKLGKVLGPRGLMPNPKLGTVTFDVAKAVNELRAGRAEYRVDKAGIIHSQIGRSSMDASKLADNLNAVMEALVKAKPQTAKGTYIKKIALSATMGPGIRVDVAPFKV